MKKDKERTKILENQNLKVIRFSNRDIDKNFFGVCTVIDCEVKKRHQR
jgi:very-short-patch-repair endonuclease